jgi:hypothetical protein
VIATVADVIACLEDASRSQRDIRRDLLRQPRSAVLHAAYRDHLAAHRARLLGPAA